MKTKVLSEFITVENQVFVALDFFDKGQRNVGIFWQKSQHEYISIPHFVPVVVSFAFVKDEDEVASYLLKRIADKSLKILVDEISLDVMALIATKWLNQIESG